MYGCRKMQRYDPGGSCLRKIDENDPIKSARYLTLGNFQEMYNKNMHQGTPMGNMYKRPGPDPKAGYSPGGQNSGSPILSEVFGQDYAMRAAMERERYNSIIYAFGPN